MGTSDLGIDPDSEAYDILDETLTLFRANTLFRNFEIKGPADRVLIYGILWISECLGRVKPNMSMRDAEKVRIENKYTDMNQKGKLRDRARVGTAVGGSRPFCAAW